MMAHACKLSVKKRWPKDVEARRSICTKCRQALKTRERYADAKESFVEASKQILIERNVGPKPSTFAAISLYHSQRCQSSQALPWPIFKTSKRVSPKVSVHRKFKKTWIDQNVALLWSFVDCPGSIDGWRASKHCITGDKLSKLEQRGSPEEKTALERLTSLVDRNEASRSSSHSLTSCQS